MAILDQQDPRKVPARPTATSFCDACHTLTKVTQYRIAGGRIAWLCEQDQPNARLLARQIIANSPPPADAVNSPELAQWIETAPPPDLDADVPMELLDLEIDALVLAEDAARESEPLAAERSGGADEEDR
jgi:hypothetical protein